MKGFICNARKKKNGKRQKNNYAIEGMCLGMCFGMMITGVTFRNSAEIGCSLGMLIGFVAGLCIQKKSENGE